MQFQITTKFYHDSIRKSTILWKDGEIVTKTLFCEEPVQTWVFESHADDLDQIEGILSLTCGNVEFDGRDYLW